MKPDIELARGEMRQPLDRAWKRIEIAPTTAANSMGEDAAENTAG